MIHRHRSVVVLPDGTLCVACSFDAADPYGRDEEPDYGLYFDRRWQPPWAHGHVEWPDLGVPANPTELVAGVTSVLDRARAGERVEVGCLGGHGRTGTALAVLAILTGQPGSEAVEWVRAMYCARAVETTEQERFVIRCLMGR
jgi:protein-tyrosine phosphatase